MSSNNKYRHNMLVGPSSEKPARFGVNGANRKQQDNDAALDFSEIWLTLRRGKWLILFTCLIVTGAVAGYTYMQEPEYESESLVMVERGGGEGGAALAGFGGDREGRGLQNEIGKLQFSGDLVQRVIERLTETADAMEASTAKQYFPVLYGDEGERLNSADITRVVRGRMSFERVEGQDMLRIRAWSSVPEEASRLANIYAEEYQVYARESSRAGAAAAREFLEEQVERRGERLDDIDDQLVRFQLDQDFASRGAAGERVLQEFTAQRQRLETLEGEKLQLEFQLERLEEELRNIEPDMDSRITDDIELQRLQTEVQELSRRIADLEQEAEEFYMNDPDLRGNEEQVDELAAIVRRIDRLQERRDGKISELAQKSAGSRFAGGDGQMGYAAQLRTNIIEVEGRLMGVRAQIETVQNRLAEQRPEVQGVPRQQIELEQLQRERNIVAEQHSNYLARLHDTMMSEQADLGYVELVQQARVPAVPVRPDMQQNVILGLLLGLGFGVGLAFLYRASAGRIEKPEDLQLNGYSVVGVVPAMKREIKSSFGGSETVEVDGHQINTHLMTLLNPWSPIAENYRLIRTNIQAGDGDVPPVMLVTSPEMGDGKTVTACNLAIALARNGLQTLLIDADLRRPNAHALLGAAQSPGLGERLRGGTAASNLRGLETFVENLHFLPAGTNENPPAELLGTKHMQDLLEAARAQFDVVIIDSPPVLAVTDSVVLSRAADATFVVVSANATELAALNTTRDTLEAVGSSVAGVILNRFDENKSAYQYGYGYGYGRTEAYNKGRVTA